MARAPYPFEDSPPRERDDDHKEKGSVPMRQYESDDEEDSSDE